MWRCSGAAEHKSWVEECESDGVGADVFCVAGL